MIALYFLAGGILGLCNVFLAVLCYSFHKKSKIETAMSVQCSSGDSEVMSFNYNFLHGESDQSKRDKIAEAFKHIQYRRDENHAKWLENKTAQIAENEAMPPEEFQAKVSKANKIAMAQ